MLVSVLAMAAATAASTPMRLADVDAHLGAEEPVVARPAR